MKHVGDITKLSGYTLPTVDVICGGSPCQDLSLAGKRAGLSGERSGLFMEQIRIIREMREKDGSTAGRAGFMVRPRFGIWENVPGAFSSNEGKDFQAVLTEFIKIAEPEAPDVPMPEGGWPKQGFIYDELAGWSLAWRLHDAQYWGVPQRRKRLCVLADFGGLAAAEILLDPQLWGATESGEPVPPDQHPGAGCRSEIPAQCESNSGNPSESGETRKRTPTDPEDGADDTGAENVTATLRAQANGHPPLVLDAAGFCLEHSAKSRGIGYEEGVSPTPRAGVVPGAIVYGISSFDSNAMKSDNPHSGIYEADTARTLDLNGGNPACNQGGMVVVAIEGNGARPSNKGPGYSEDGVMYTLNATEQHGVSYVSIENHPNDSRVKINEDGIVQTLSQRMGTGGGNVPLVMDVGFFQTYEDKTGTLLARQYKDPPIVLESNQNNATAKQTDVCPTLPAAIVRRLTPLECERLQGFPDYWTDIGDWVDSKGKKHKGDSDAPRYKALGNSISLPFWQFVARRICAQYERDITMGSLFDGIGGFPLVFERCGAKAVWASEIEEFPIAVTKKHFPEADQ